MVRLTLIERAVERSYYIVRVGDDGRPRICVALTRTVTTDAGAKEEPAI